MKCHFIWIIVSSEITTDFCSFLTHKTSFLIWIGILELDLVLAWHTVLRVSIDTVWHRGTCNQEEGICFIYICSLSLLLVFCYKNMSYAMHLSGDLKYLANGNLWVSFKRSGVCVWFGRAHERTTKAATFFEVWIVFCLRYFCFAKILGGGVVWPILDMVQGILCFCLFWVFKYWMDP